MTAAVLLAGAATIALWLGGYLVGARAGRQARAALRATAEEQARLQGVAAQQAVAAEERTYAAEARVRHERERVVDAERRAALAEGQAAQLAQQLTANMGLERELRSALAPLAEREAELKRLTENVQRVAGAVAASGEEQRALKSAIEGFVKPLHARDGEARQMRLELEQIMEKLDTRAGDERLRQVVAEAIRPLQEGTRADRLQAVVAEAIRPMVDGERLGLDLARLRLGESRRDLSDLLTAIADQGGFSTVIISDERGLLLAASEGSLDATVRAGLSALALTLADSYLQSDVPVPLAVLVHDSANQAVLSRIFTVDGDRFLLTAVTKGRFVAPNLLDPTLDRIEKLMADWTTTQERPALPGPSSQTVSAEPRGL